MEFFKKQRVGFYGLIISAIVLVIGTILFEIAYKNGIEFFVQQAPKAPTNVILFCIFSIVLMIVAVLIRQFKVEGIVKTILSIVSDILIVVAVLLIGMAVITSIKAYAYDMAIWLGSPLHNGDDKVIAAIKLGVVSSILMLVSVLVSAVTTCFAIKADE